MNVNKQLSTIYGEADIFLWQRNVCPIWGLPQSHLYSVLKMVFETEMEMEGNPDSFQVEIGLPI